MARDIAERFLVAFSLAGEQRELVRSIAIEVERQLGEGTVFFDEWYEHWIAGSDADLLLQEIYHTRCELAIVCLSGDYGDKPWTQAEHRAIRARHMTASRSPQDRLRVLAIRVGDGDVEGILLNEIAPDIRGRSIEGAARLVIDRLDLVRPTTGSHSDGDDLWPEYPPEFDWPMADHSEAQHAIHTLLTRSSSTLLLRIEGESETGKSHLSRQIERNVVEHLPTVRCGRFDFKGTTNRQIEVEGFALSLGLETPQVPDLNEQLAQTLFHLRAKPRPTLLIFDTYESAGDTGGWVERVFLSQLLTNPWLRVVILGQRTPSSDNERWQSIAGHLIKLTLPEPEDWHEYAQAQKPNRTDVTLEFITKAHRLAHGKPTLLAALLGSGSG